MAIHPTAVVDARAELGSDVEVGPCAMIGAGVVVGDRCRIGPHAVLEGPLTMGEECVVGPSAVIGGEPQVKGKEGPWGRARVGNRTVLREFCQVNRSFSPDGETVVGDDCFFMAAAHIGHDCIVGNEVILTNGTLLAGHVECGDRAFIGGHVGIHQFVRIGEVSMIGGLSGINRDVPPFCIALGDRPKALSGLNLVGLRRSDRWRASRQALKAAYRTLFLGTGPVAARLESVDVGEPAVARLVEFIRATKRGVVGIHDRLRDE